MNDDLIDKVARAISDAPRLLGEIDARTAAHAAVAAHTDYLLALGGVTDEEAGLAAALSGTLNRYAAFRDLTARAVAQARATPQYDLAYLYAEQVRREAAEAKVARVEAFADSLVPIAHGTRRNGHFGNPAVLALLDRLRAALADEDGDA